MAAVKSVLVVGGGIAGLTVAAALCQKGIACRVIESGKQSDRLGTGITLLGNTLRALQTIGLADACIGAGYGFDHVIWRDAGGTLLTEFKPPNYFRPDRPASAGIMRPVLGDLLEANALQAGATIDFETTVESLEETPTEVIVRLSSGEEARAELVIGADGVYSKMRERLFGPDLKPAYCGQGGWRYTAARPESLYGITFYRAANGAVLGGIPLSPTHCYYFVLEHEREVTRKPRERLAEMFKERMAPFTAPELVEARNKIDASSQISYRPFDTLMMPDPWHKGRAIVIGDAAHSLSPQLTSGGGMAIEDAVVLAEELERSTDVFAALVAFMRRRIERVGAIYQTSMNICLNEQSASPNDEEALRLLKQGHGILAAPF